MMWKDVLRAFGAATEAEAAILRTSKERHPDEAIGWSSVVADEPARVVVAVQMGEGATGRRREYAFDRQTGAVTELGG